MFYIIFIKYFYKSYNKLTAKFILCLALTSLQHLLLLKVQRDFREAQAVAEQNLYTIFCSTFFKIGWISSLS